MDSSKLVLYISMSLDGFIATNDDDLSWLSIAEKEGEDYGYSDFNETIDTYIVGRKTYDVILNLTGGKLPQASAKDCYVLTRTPKESENGVTFFSGDIPSFINDLKSKKGKNIYCDGGGEVVQLLMKDSLIDEYIISVMPIILGDGKPLFKGGINKIDIELQSSKSFESGVVQLHYSKR